LHLAEDKEFIGDIEWLAFALKKNDSASYPFGNDISITNAASLAYAGAPLAPAAELACKNHPSLPALCMMARHIPRERHSLPAFAAIAKQKKA